MKKRYSVTAVLVVSMLVTALAAMAATPAPELPVLNWEPRSDWIGVKDHGAVGDGEADDTAAVQSVLDNAKSGMTIYFPAGTYRITETLHLRNDNPRGAGPYHVGVNFGMVEPDVKVPVALGSLTLIGHGRDSRLVWDGHSGYPLLQTEGMTGSRIVGIDFDGGGGRRSRASVGLYWCSRYTFGTGNIFRHVAFRNFLANGVLYEWHEPTRWLANAETSFENCLFVNCGTGISFTQFNDYNYSFDGCEFWNNDVGIMSRHGNFFVRNSHFRNSRIVDIQSYSEHGCTVRRCTSLGSNRFIDHHNIVSTLIVEGCTVQSWRDPSGAIRVSGAPVLLFDNTFLNYSLDPNAAKGAVRFQGGGKQTLLLSGNEIRRLPDLMSHRERPGATDDYEHAMPRWLDHEAWPESEEGRIYHIPAGRREGQRLAGDQRFLKSEVAVPGRVFDAKRDFGAKGNSSSDDTEAIQKTIAAARAHGEGAIAYLPAGRYVVRETLELSGGNYYVGGAGKFATRIEWRGRPGQPTVVVREPDRLVMENIGLGRSPDHRQAPDILQEGGGGPSYMVYDNVSVSMRERLAEPPFLGGLQMQNLCPDEVVLIPYVHGNLRLTDSAAATVLVSFSTYGAVTLEGRAHDRSGFFGVLTRFDAGRWQILVGDNHSLVMSDYYTEGSINGPLIEGNPGDPEGRVTIQGAKTANTESWFNIRNYQGQVFFGPSQFCHRSDARFYITGERQAELYLMGCTFYRPALNFEIEPPSAVYRFGNWPIGTEREGERLSTEQVREMFADNLPEKGLSDAAHALDDLRRLGEADLRLNHPAVLKP